jgi:hypothetical protein
MNSYEFYAKFEDIIELGRVGRTEQALVTSDTLIETIKHASLPAADRQRYLSSVLMEKANLLYILGRDAEASQLVRNSDGQ